MVIKNENLIRRLNTEILFLSRKMFSMFGVQYEIDDSSDTYMTILVCIPKEYHTTMEQISRNIKKSINDFYPINSINTNLFKFIDSENWDNQEVKDSEVGEGLVCRIMISDDNRLIKTYSNDEGHFLEVGLGI